MAESPLPVVSHAIQLAIAPVFLLTGISSLLGVMANRLARVIDRARALEEGWPQFDDYKRRLVLVELPLLERRRSLASWSINFCTAGALLVCLVIVTLFIDEFTSQNLRWAAGLFFVLAMVSLSGGLATFLREVYIATHSTVIDASRLMRTDGG
ncbi:MAG TPA: DUF2721 domain-containing protein [Casimicrobiaceae bacterium]|nr:DUF2721 domain-containing protein [Casimicrobiaceae bacterium]